MMQQAFTDIQSSDMLIVKVSDKAIGVGIEIRICRCPAKTLIYLRNAPAEHSTTAAGSAQQTVIYQNARQLQEQLTAVLSVIAVIV